MSTYRKHGGLGRRSLNVTGARGTSSTGSADLTELDSLAVINRTVTLIDRDSGCDSEFQ
jgi:hypothetical protein